MTTLSAHLLPQPQITFNLEKIQTVYDNYTENFHAGVTMVIGHPFNDETFRKKIGAEQQAIKEVFVEHHLEDVLVLCDVEYQVHATIIELARQHDKVGTTQRILEDEELIKSSYTKNTINMDYSIHWIKKMEPFEVELGSNVLSEEHRDHTLRILDTGQIVMKGRAKDRKIMADIRSEFESNAHIIHRYGKEDDEFFFVIGFLKPDIRLLDQDFRMALEKCINIRRAHIRLALKVDAVKIIVTDKYSLDADACLWESKELKFGEVPDFPQKTLLDTIRAVNEKLKLALEADQYKDAV